LGVDLSSSARRATARGLLGENTLQNIDLRGVWRTSFGANSGSCDGVQRFEISESKRVDNAPREPVVRSYAPKLGRHEIQIDIN